MLAWVLGVECEVMIKCASEGICLLKAVIRHNVYFVDSITSKYLFFLVEKSCLFV